MFDELHDCNHAFMEAKRSCDRIFYRAGEAVGLARQLFTPELGDCFMKAERDKWECTDDVMLSMTG